VTDQGKDKKDPVTPHRMTSALPFVENRPIFLALKWSAGTNYGPSRIIA